MRWEHWIYTLPLRLRSLFSRAAVERELDDELRYHLDRETEANIAAGMHQQEARRTALRALDGITRPKEECRDALGWRLLDTVIRDFRFALRSMRHSPGFSLVAVLTLALGIGSNAAIFSFVDAVFLRPLPYEHAERIVRVVEKRPSGDTAWISTLTYLDWKQDNAVFDQIAAQQDGRVTLTGTGEPVPLRVGRVSAHYFDVFGIKPFLGRTFADGEDEPGKDHVVILSHALWSQQFGSDMEIAGKTILLDNAPFIVVGVIPSSSAFDRGSAQIWHPLAFKPANMNRDYHWLSASFARLKPGVSLEQARSQMDTISARLAREYPDSNKGWGVAVDRYADSIVGPQLRTSLLALMAAVSGLLLICCSNLANLALARTISRGREVAMRASLGASRLRLVQQFLMENVVLAICGGSLGVVFGYAGITWLKMLIPPGGLPRETSVQLDARVLVFALAISVLTGILFGLAPALYAAKPALAESMKEGGRSTTAGSSSRRLRDVLVVAQVAVAFVLLCGSGLLIRSFFSLLNVDTGFDSTNVLTMTLPVPGFPPGSGYSSPRVFNTYLRDLQSSIGALPGVRQAAFTNGLPLTDCCLYSLSMQIASHPKVDRAGRGGGFFKVVSPSYFPALGLTLREGRFLTDQDTTSSRPVIVINERLAKRYFPGEDPIGQIIFNPEIIPGKTERGPDIAWEVVGIVADEKIGTLNDGSSAVVYAAYEQSPVYFANLIVRADVDPTNLENQVRQAIYDVDKTQAITDIRTLQRIKSGTMANDRFRTILLFFFSTAALALAAIGMYGVISYSVAQRTHEFGIRAALGASPATLMRLVLSKGLVLTFIGLALGAGGALGMNRLLTSILYNVDARDPYTMASVAAILALVALASSFFPARRVTKIDPLAALRGE